MSLSLCECVFQIPAAVFIKVSEFDGVKHAHTHTHIRADTGLRSAGPLSNSLADLVARGFFWPLFSHEESNLCTEAAMSLTCNDTAVKMRIFTLLRK